MLLICFFGGRTLQLDAVICIKKQAELSIYIEPSLIIYFTMQQRFADAPRSTGMLQNTNFMDKILRSGWWNNHCAWGKAQHNRPIRIRYKSAVSAQCLIPEEAREREQSAIAKCANACTHGVRFKTCWLQACQWQPCRPEQAMDQNGIGCDHVSANREQGTAGDNGEWKQDYPWYGTAVAHHKANPDACAQDSREWWNNNEWCAPGRFVVFHSVFFCVDVRDRLLINPDCAIGQISIA